MAQIIQMTGLHGAGLELFHRACAIVQRDEQSERHMREARKLLGFAHRASGYDYETADAFVARAANKVALALGAPR